MLDANPHRPFWEWVTYAAVFAFTYVAGGVGMGFDLELSRTLALPKPLAIAGIAALGAWIFKTGNERDWPFAGGLAAYAATCLLGIWLLSQYLFSGAPYFTPFVLLFGWLICQWVFTTIPD